MKPENTDYEAENFIHSNEEVKNLRFSVLTTINHFYDISAKKY